MQYLKRDKKRTAELKRKYDLTPKPAEDRKHIDHRDFGAASARFQCGRQSGYPRPDDHHIRVQRDRLLGMSAIIERNYNYD